MDETSPKPLTKRQLALAARLYALSVLAQQDTGGASSEEESNVMELAIETARGKLLRMGHEKFGYVGLADCIAVARATPQGANHEPT